MKIPKYIQNLINKRAGLAAELNSADYKLSKWLDDHGIAVEDYDNYGGCEVFANPYDSAERIKQAIIKK